MFLITKKAMKEAIDEIIEEKDRMIEYLELGANKLGAKLEEIRSRQDQVLKVYDIFGLKSKLHYRVKAIDYKFHTDYNNETAQQNRMVLNSYVCFFDRDKNVVFSTAEKVSIQVMSIIEDTTNA